MEGYVESASIIDEVPILDGIPTISVRFYGCNFSCPFCYAKDFLSFNEKKLIPLREVKNDIKRISPNADQILFTGGEPTLQRLALIDLIEFSRSLDLSTILFTNGSKYEVIKELVDKQLIDKFLVTLVEPFEDKLFKEYTRVNNFFIKTKDIISSVKSSLEYISKNNTTTDLEIVTPIVPTLNDDFTKLIKIARYVYNLRVRWNIIPFSKKVLFDGSMINDKFFESIEPPTIFQIQSLVDKIKKTYHSIDIKIRESDY